VAVYAGLVLDLCHSLGRPLVDRRPNLLTLSQLSVIMLRTCKRSIRTGVNDLSGLYNGASPYRNNENKVRVMLRITD
jgi:hypothetical protein